MNSQASSVRTEAIPACNAGRYFQNENHVNMAMDRQLAASLAFIKQP